MLIAASLLLSSAPARGPQFAPVARPIVGTHPGEWQRPRPARRRLRGAQSPRPELRHHERPRHPAAAAGTRAPRDDHVLARRPARHRPGDPAEHGPLAGRRHAAVGVRRLAHRRRRRAQGPSGRHVQRLHGPCLRCRFPRARTGLATRSARSGRSCPPLPSSSPRCSWPQASGSTSRASAFGERGRRDAQGPRSRGARLRRPASGAGDGDSDEGGDRAPPAEVAAAGCSRPARRDQADRARGTAGAGVAARPARRAASRRARTARALALDRERRGADGRCHCARALCELARTSARSRPIPRFRSSLPTPSRGEPGIASTGAPVLWAQGVNGQGITVATLDTGVDLTHPELASHYRGGGNSWFDPYGQHASPMDISGHGTEVTGVLVAGGGIGMAPGAKFIATRAFDDAGGNSASGIHAAFQWLLDPDHNPATADAPNVVNISWGARLIPCSFEFQPDLQALRAAHILPVVAAGNDGQGPAPSDNSPANLPEAFAVGATTSPPGIGPVTIAPFSSRGPSMCGGGQFPALVAPGTGIRTTGLAGFDVTGGRGNVVLGAARRGRARIAAPDLPAAHGEPAGEPADAERRRPGSTGSRFHLRRGPARRRRGRAGAALARARPRPAGADGRRGHRHDAAGARR